MIGRLRWLYSILALIATLGLASVGVPSAEAQGVVNAIGYYNNNGWGARAQIETANPQVRDGDWSWARVGVQCLPSDCGNNEFSEIGWMKYGNGQIVVRTSHSHNGAPPTGNNYNSVSVGSTHTYTVTWKSSAGCWSLQYDGVQKECPYTSLSLSRTFSGGEASSGANAIGVSGCLTNAYQPNNGGAWYTVPNHSNYADPGYGVSNLALFSWQVWGNN